MERSRACTYVEPASLLDSPVPPATAAALPLAVEVGGGDRSAEAVALGQIPGDEVGAPPWRVDGLPRCLPEHDECHTVDPRRRLRLLVRHHLSACMHAPEQMLLNVEILFSFMKDEDSFVFLRAKERRLFFLFEGKERRKLERISS